MKRIVVAIGILVVLVADGAAIHDIIIGESDVRTEWTALAISALIIGLLIYRLRMGD